MLDLFDFIKNSTLSLSFMLVFITVFVLVITTLVIFPLIFMRKIPFIAWWDSFWDGIVLVAEKALIVVVFIFFFATAGSYLDMRIGTTIEFSSLSGVIGAIVGVRFLFII